MIRTFRHKGLKRLFETGSARGVSADLAGRLLRQLDILNRAVATQDMNLPGYRLHELKGDRKGAWSLHVTRNRRLTFRIEDDEIIDLNVEDYH